MNNEIPQNLLDGLEIASELVASFSYCESKLEYMRETNLYDNKNLQKISDELVEIFEECTLSVFSGKDADVELDIDPFLTLINEGISAELSIAMKENIEKELKRGYELTIKAYEESQGA